MTPHRFRRKPRTIEAVEYDGTAESVTAIHEWLDGVVTTEGGFGGLGATLLVAWRGQHTDVQRGEWLTVDKGGRLGRIDGHDLAEDYEERPRWWHGGIRADPTVWAPNESEEW